MSLGFNVSISSIGSNLAPATQQCGPHSGPNSEFGCTAPANLIKPVTYTLASTYAGDNAAFLQAFALAYTKMTTVGYTGTSATATTTTGKLGTLTSIDLSTC